MWVISASQMHMQWDGVKQVLTWVYQEPIRQHKQYAHKDKVRGIQYTSCLPSAN